MKGTGGNLRISHVHCSDDMVSLGCHKFQVVRPNFCRRHTQELKLIFKRDLEVMAGVPVVKFEQKGDKHFHS